MPKVEPSFWSGNRRGRPQPIFGLPFTLRRCFLAMTCFSIAAALIGIDFYDYDAQQWLVHNSGGDWGMLFLLISIWFIAPIIGIGVGLILFKDAWLGVLFGVLGGIASLLIYAGWLNWPNVFPWL